MPACSGASREPQIIAELAAPCPRRGRADRRANPAAGAAQACAARSNRSGNRSRWLARERSTHRPPAQRRSTPHQTRRSARGAHGPSRRHLKARRRRRASSPRVPSPTTMSTALFVASFSIMDLAKTYGVSLCNIRKSFSSRPFDHRSVGSRSACQCPADDLLAEVVARSLARGIDPH